MALARGWQSFPTCWRGGARELAPHAVAFYLRELAGEFHSYYNAERILVEDEALRARGSRFAPRCARRSPTACRSSASARRRRCEMASKPETFRHAQASAGGFMLGMFVGADRRPRGRARIAFYLNKTPCRSSPASQAGREGRRAARPGDRRPAAGRGGRGRPKSRSSTSTRSCPGRKSRSPKGSCATG
jgi:hypothetical protein